jgi:hypothetical protein
LPDSDVRGYWLSIADSYDKLAEVAEKHEAEGGAP